MGVCIDFGWWINHFLSLFDDFFGFSKMQNSQIEISLILQHAHRKFYNFWIQVFRSKLFLLLIKPDTHGWKKPVEKNLNFFNFKPFFTTIINQRGRVVVVSNEINSNECHPLLHFYVRLLSTQSKSLWFFCSETQHVLYFCFSPITKKKKKIQIRMAIVKSMVNEMSKKKNTGLDRLVRSHSIDRLWQK